MRSSPSGVATNGTERGLPVLAPFVATVTIGSPPKASVSVPRPPDKRSAIRSKTWRLAEKSRAPGRDAPVLFMVVLTQLVRASCSIMASPFPIPADSHCSPCRSTVVHQGSRAMMPGSAEQGWFDSRQEWQGNKKPTIASPPLRCGRPGTG
jgi:hypothetical protein